MPQVDARQCAKCGVLIVTRGSDGTPAACRICSSPLDSPDAEELSLACPLPRCGLLLGIRRASRGKAIVCPGCDQPYRVVNDDGPVRLRPIARPV